MCEAPVISIIISLTVLPFCNYHNYTILREVFQSFISLLHIITIMDKKVVLLYGNNNTTYTFKAQIFSNKYSTQLSIDYLKTVSVRFYFSYTSPAVGQIILQRDHTAIPRKPEKTGPNLY